MPLHLFELQQRLQPPLLQLQQLTKWLFKLLTVEQDQFTAVSSSTSDCSRFCQVATGGPADQNSSQALTLIRSPALAAVCLCQLQQRHRMQWSHSFGSSSIPGHSAPGAVGHLWHRLVLLCRSVYTQLAVCRSVMESGLGLSWTIGLLHI